MRVRMLQRSDWQDAGVERPLSAGVVYDLPAGIGSALVALGIAVEVEALTPPETKPLQAIETKRGRK